MTIILIALCLIGFLLIFMGIFWMENPFQRASNIHLRDGETIQKSWIIVPLPFGHHIEIHKRAKPVTPRSHLEDASF